MSSAKLATSSRSAGDICSELTVTVASTSWAETEAPASRRRTGMTGRPYLIGITTGVVAYFRTAAERRTGTIRYVLHGPRQRRCDATTPARLGDTCHARINVEHFAG